MSVILVSTIVRNEARYLERYHDHLKRMVAHFAGQHDFLLSIYENDSDDGSAAKLVGLDWSFLPAYQITTARQNTPYFIGGKHPVRTELLARARNQSIYYCGFPLGAINSVLSIEPDIAYSMESAEKVINHEKRLGKRYDVFTGKSVHPGTTHLYDSWGTRKTEKCTDWADGDQNQEAGVEEVWSTYNCFALYNFEPIKKGLTYSGTNPRTKQPDCDTVSIVEAFRLGGYNKVAWDTTAHFAHDCT